MFDIVRKLRMWGVKGAIDYLKARHEEIKWHKFFADTAVNAYPVLGITIIGGLSSQGSTNKVLRDLCFSLKDAGIPFQTYDMGKKEIPAADILPILTPPSEFHINKYTCLLEMLASPVQDGLVSQRGRIVFWEFESGVLEAYPALIERAGDVIAMSDFNYEYLRRTLLGRRNVFKILYPLRLAYRHIADVSQCRKQFGFDQYDFIVFYNFSYASGWNRKNPLGALKAFARIANDIPHAKLVMKTTCRNRYEDRARQLMDFAASCGLENRVIFVDNYLAQNDLYKLTNACDVYLSLHRSEGFGLGIAEAMMMEKPVVITGYSAPTEFCDRENSVLVPYRMIPVDCSDVKWYAAAKEWAEPDVERAAQALKQLHSDPALRMRLGKKARGDILRHFSIENFKASVVKYLYRGGQT